MQQVHRLRSGQEVQAFDRQPLGVVAALDEGRLLVAPPRGSPFWLPMVLVRTVEGELVVLHVGQATVARYRQDTRQPAPGPGRRHHLQRAASRARIAAIGGITALLTLLRLR